MLLSLRRVDTDEYITEIIDTAVKTPALLEDKHQRLNSAMPNV
jgi:hypothetical protein